MQDFYHDFQVTVTTRILARVLDHVRHTLPAFKRHMGEDRNNGRQPCPKRDISVEQT